MQKFNPEEEQGDFLEKKELVELQLKKQHQQFLKAKNKLSQDLEAALRWEEVQHEATLLQSNLFKIEKGMSQITVNDWLQDNTEKKILLDPTMKPADEIAKRFQKSKKLKRGIEPLRFKLEQIKKNLEKISSLLTLVPEITSEEELKIFCQKNYISPKVTSPKSKKILPALPYREFISQSGMQIWVGKSAKDNDKLTFTHGNGSDYWLHASGVPGSHVVLHLGKHKEPDEDSIKDAVQTALFYSKAKDNQEGEVCITQCKYVTRYGKLPGKVQISHHRNVYAKIDHIRLKKLRERKNNLEYEDNLSSSP